MGPEAGGMLSVTEEARAKKALEVDSPFPGLDVLRGEAELLRGRRRSDGLLEASTEEKRATMSCAAAAVVS